MFPIRHDELHIILKALQQKFWLPSVLFWFSRQVLFLIFKLIFLFFSDINTISILSSINRTICVYNLESLLKNKYYL